MIINRNLSPINKNPSIANTHTGYVAMSGYGKSQALKQNSDIPANGVRVVMWDPDEDHKAKHYECMDKFRAALVSSMKSGSGFRLAWSGAVDHKTFEYFCWLCWICGNGKKPLFVIIEELADVSKTAGKASEFLGMLFRRGRKYNIKIHWTTQRSQEIPKTCFSQSAVKYIGYPDETCTPSNAVELGRIAGVSSSELYALHELEFYRRQDKKTQMIKLKYKK